jgi:hypothetical protein
VVPLDVRDEYGKLYERRTEERLKIEPMRIELARAKHREWSSEMEARFANIRAAREGKGSTLTPKEARALAGEWYEWFTARMATNGWSADVWGDYQWSVRLEMGGGVLPGDDPLNSWERDSATRDRVRPMIADEAKCEQFLAAKRRPLDPASGSCSWIM